jgi:dolichol kinase
MEAGLLSGAANLSIHKATERNRRLVHFAFGACALLIGPLGSVGSAVLAGAALLYNALLAPLLGLDRSYRRAGEGWWGGLTTYPLAVLLLVVLTPPQVAAGSWVVLATVDPVAAAVGSRRPRPRVPLNPAKSLIGTAAGFLAGAVTCTGLFLFLGEAHAWPSAVGAAAAGAVAEALPLPFEDNLTVAAAAALALLPWFA